MPDEESTDDRQLLKRISNKDRAAFELLYRRFYPQLLHFVRRMLKESDLADEVVDDSLFAVWRTADSFEGRSKVSTWIFGIAYRQALKAIAKAERRPEMSRDPELIDAMLDERSQTEHDGAGAADDMNTVLAKGMASLSADHQSVLELAAMGHDAAEIAEIVDCPTATVRTRLFYARRMLKQFLAHCDDSITLTQMVGRHA